MLFKYSEKIVVVSRTRKQISALQIFWACYRNTVIKEVTTS